MDGAPHDFELLDQHYEAEGQSLEGLMLYLGDSDDDPELSVRGEQGIRSKEECA